MFTRKIENWRKKIVKLYNVNINLYYTYVYTYVLYDK